MSEINTGIRSVLKYGWIYRLSQSFFGEKKSKHFIIDNFFTRRTPNTVMLDMGCGAGNFAYFIPPGMRYIGFDPNKNYIDSAKRKFSSNSALTFLPGTANSLAVNDHIDDESIDYAVIHGVLHHLSDDEILPMYRLAERVLKPGGRLISLEPVWYQGQSLLNSWVMSLDRGKNIKPLSEWLDIAHENSESWGTIRHQISQNLIRFYDLIIIDISKNERN